MKFSRQEKPLTENGSRERLNQKQRTREALIEAAVALARAGRSLQIAEVAEAARVSTATAYRYFPNPQSLWREVAEARNDVRDIGALFDSAPEEPLARLDYLVKYVAEMQFADETLWRAILSAAMERWFGQMDLPKEERVPVRRGQRLIMARRAIAGLESRMPPALFRKLTMAVVLVYGTDAMVAMLDSCELEPEEAKDVMRWAARALVRSALAEAEDPGTG